MKIEHKLVKHKFSSQQNYKEESVYDILRYAFDDRWYRQYVIR